MMTSMAGVAIMDIGPKTTSSNMLAAGLVSVGLVEQLHNRAEASNRDRHLQTPSHQPESVMPVVHRLDSSDL